MARRTLRVRAETTKNQLEQVVPHSAPTSARQRWIAQIPASDDDGERGTGLFLASHEVDGVNEWLIRESQIFISPGDNPLTSRPSSNDPALVRPRRPGASRSLAPISVPILLDPGSVPDALAILTQLSDRGVRIALGSSVYDWQDPFARMFLQILAVIAEFEANLIRQRTREGMAVARARGKLRGKPPKLTAAQAREVRRMHDSGEYAIAGIAELFRVSRPTIYRVLQRTAAGADLPVDARPVPDIFVYDEMLASHRPVAR